MLHRCFLLCLLRHWQFLSDENKMKAKKKALHSTLNKKKTEYIIMYPCLHGTMKFIWKTKQNYLVQIVIIYNK
jgi:hypothetical protein